MEMTWGELNLIRQWFDAIQDINKAYLKKEDYVLAGAIYEKLGMRVPDSITKGATT